MHPRVVEYITERQAEIKQDNEKEKQRFLLREGLFEKVYSPDGHANAEYAYSEWNESEKCYVYYKRVPLEVTDEEFEEMKKVYREKRRETSMSDALTSQNPIATLLTVIAWVSYIGLFIAGIALGRHEVGTYYTRTEFSLALALPYWIAGLVSGTLFLGFAEVIKLLTDIKQQKK